MKKSNNLFIDIWTSFRALPLWVQVWVMVILFPINVASLFFLNEPSGGLIAFLAIIAMLPNLPILVYLRGFSKMLALPHVIPWAILVIIILVARPVGSSTYNSYLWVLLIINIISLLFDIPDSIKWLKGDRAVAR